MHSSHRRLATAALALAPFAFALPAAAQDGQPVRLIVGYAAGGPVDQGARLFAPALAKELGMPVMVENKTGANATIAGNEVVRAKPDGLTLWFAASPTITISPNVMTKMPFDPAKDLDAGGAHPELLQRAGGEQQRALQERARLGGQRKSQPWQAGLRFGRGGWIQTIWVRCCFPGAAALK